MTILDVIYASPDGLSVVIVTEERGAVLASQSDRPDLWQAADAWAQENGGVKPFPEVVE